MSVLMGTQLWEDNKEPGVPGFLALYAFSRTDLEKLPDPHNPFSKCCWDHLSRGKQVEIGAVPGSVSEERLREEVAMERLVWGLWRAGKKSVYQGCCGTSVEGHRLPACWELPCVSSGALWTCPLTVPLF